MHWIIKDEQWLNINNSAITKYNVRSDKNKTMTIIEEIDINIIWCGTIWY